MFRTEIFLPNSPVTINLHDKILTVGSCFSDTIGHQLFQNKFNSLINPFGATYNPHSIHKTLLYAIHNQIVPENTHLKSKDIYLNYDFHSSFSSLDKTNNEKKLKETIGSAHFFLKNTNWVFLTYGTAWVYERNDTGEIVANCHKEPAPNFEKVLLSQKKVLESFAELYKQLKAFNPDIKLILTVSPVRHLKDTLQLNSISKSVLRLACQTIVETYQDAFYFPAYEIMLDDLRDYRFYKPDMLHPSEEAETYIWNKFLDCFFDTTTKDFVRQWKPVRAALNHKAFHLNSEAHQSFLRNTLAQLESLSRVVNLDAEILAVKEQLTK